MNFLKLGIVLVGVCQIFDIAKYLILRSSVSLSCAIGALVWCVGLWVESWRDYRFSILAEGMKVECFMALAVSSLNRGKLIFCHSYVHLILPI